jgi:transcriptional regulator with XRE-family HTH domain
MAPLELNLRKHREGKGLSQAQLAKLARIRQAAISDLETGKRRSVDLDALDRIAKVLGCEPGDLLGREKRRVKK